VYNLPHLNNIAMKDIYIGYSNVANFKFEKGRSRLSPVIDRKTLTFDPVTQNQ